MGCDYNSIYRTINRDTKFLQDEFIHRCYCSVNHFPDLLRIKSESSFSPIFVALPAKKGRIKDDQSFPGLGIGATGI